MTFKLNLATRCQIVLFSVGLCHEPKLKWLFCLFVVVSMVFGISIEMNSSFDLFTWRYSNSFLICQPTLRKWSSYFFYCKSDNQKTIDASIFILWREDSISLQDASQHLFMLHWVQRMKLVMNLYVKHKICLLIRGSLLLNTTLVPSILTNFFGPY